MFEKTIVTEEWLSERALLHDAFAIGAQLFSNNLVIEIDDQWSGLQGSSDQICPSPGSLIFEGAVIHIGNVEETSGRFINELIFENGRWQLFLATKRMFGRRGLLVFYADGAFFQVNR